MVLCPPRGHGGPPDAHVEAGRSTELRVLGLASIADDVDPELARATITAVEVLGAFRAPVRCRRRSVPDPSQNAPSEHPEEAVPQILPRGRPWTAPARPAWRPPCA